MKLATLTCCIAFLFCCQNKAQNAMATTTNSTETMTKQSIHQFKVTDLSGNTFDFASLKGKKIMVVNTASKCGLTPQYKDLEALYKTYKDKGFVIVGFPANNFASQEPGTNEEIAQFCQLNCNGANATCCSMNNNRITGLHMSHRLEQMPRRCSLNKHAESLLICDAIRNRKENCFMSNRFLCITTR